MRKAKPKKRILLPDPKFSDVAVTRFVNNLMLDGKKSIAYTIFYDSLELVGKKMKDADKSPLEVWKQALENITPQVEVKSKRIGGATFQVPMEVRPERKISISMKNLVLYSRKRAGKTMAEKLAAEIVDAYNQQGAAFKRKEEMHRMAEEGELIAARDSMGRLPVLIGQREDGYCVSFESFAYHKLDYQDAYELGPREIVRLNARGFETLSPAGKQMKICAFLWTYYGYPNSNYEGVNVELMRYRNGAIMARDEAERGGVPEVDFVAGVPDSGVPHAMGYANQSGKPLARPFVKYTPTWPRSFMPEDQQVRSKVARMKQIPVPELIEGKKLLFVDDSIVRGTQLRETVEFLYSAGASEVHMRSACPPIMYPCRYLNFSRGNSPMDLLARRIVQQLEGNEGQKHLEEYADSSCERGKCLLHAICEQFGFDSLSYQSLEGMLEAISIDREQVCTYCWTGKE